MKLSVVIPAFNEEANIGSCVQELQNSIDAIEQIKDSEIIVVDDHSADQTYIACLGLGKNVQCIRLNKRFGSHTALRAGISKAQGDIILCIAADGQDDPSVLREMINEIISGSSVVWAIRSNRNEPFMSKLFANWFYRILKLMVVDPELRKINLANADFFMVNRVICDAINSCKERNTSLMGLIVWLGFKQSHVSYQRRERLSGISKWNFKSRVRLAKDWLIAFSGLPLRLMTFLGIIMSILGFLYAIFIIIYRILGYAMLGWAETITMTLIIGGIQMIMLGLVGEYLWRNLDESRKRPLFFIERSSQTESEPDKT